MDNDTQKTFVVAFELAISLRPVMTYQLTNESKLKGTSYAA